MTQGDTLPPKLFSVVMDSVIHHWLMVVAEIEKGTEGLGISIWDLATYFYANDGLIYSAQT